MIKISLPRALLVLSLALTLGLMAAFGTSSRHGAEASSSQPIMTDGSTSVSPDNCTATQVGSYGYYAPYNYGYYGYYGGYYGMGYNAWNYPPDYSYMAPYGNTYASYSCNFTGCQPVPFYTTVVVCPGPPASITLPAAPTSATCASSSNITVTVRDANGLRVADGTTVNFTTSFGQITGSAQTQDGEATGSLQTPTKTMGTAVISITSGSASNQVSINVTCDAPGTVQAGQGAAAPVPTYMAPAPSPGYSYGGY